MAKAHETLDLAVRDGSLLNFIKLGHLATTAVPFEGSGLEEAELGKLVDLLQKMMDDSELPLQLASVNVWEDLSRLRDQVREISTKSNDDDKFKLQALQGKIDIVHSQGPYATQGLSQSDDAQAQASGSWTVLQSRRSSPEPMPGHDTLTHNSASTAVAPDYYKFSSPSESGGGEVLLLSRISNFSNLHPDFLADARSDYTNSTSDNSRKEHVNLYSVPYPHLPSQAGPSSDTTRRPIPGPLLGGTQADAPGTTPIDPSSPFVRNNNQQRLASVYYPPRRSSMSNPPTQSNLPTKFRSPTRKIHTTAPGALIVPFANDIVRTSSPPSSPVPEE